MLNKTSDNLDTLNACIHCSLVHFHSCKINKNICTEHIHNTAESESIRHKMHYYALISGRDSGFGKNTYVILEP